jgi:hypothetical protein
MADSETAYAVTADGVHIAYPTRGEGPRDLAFLQAHARCDAPRQWCRLFARSASRSEQASTRARSSTWATTSVAPHTVLQRAIQLVGTIEFDANGNVVKVGGFKQQFGATAAEWCADLP